ncbi:MAG: hypothetical protein LBV09_01600, partial [Deferribacteraceae bacterium]|nr:hypothetical protein [Deferribacteraceae bacterium]
MFRKLLFLLAFACSTLTVACGGGGGGSSDNSTPPATLELSGEITLTPAQIVLGGTLYANYSGNEKVTFQWRRNGTIIIDITGKELKPSAAGEYTVTVSLAGYIPKSSAPATVTDPVVVEDPDLNGTVNISPTSGVEVGDKLTASYTGSEAGTKIYTWTGTCVEGQTGATCTTTTAGTYKVTLNIDGFKPKDSANVTVSPIVNVPGDLAGTVSISPATAEVGDKLTASYTGSEAGNRAYTWTGTCIEGQTGATCTTTAAGAYKVTLNIEGYNPKDSAPVTVTDPVVILPGDLEGTVSISPATAEVGDILTASYDGDEGTGVYTWTGVCTDGQTGATCTTTTAGTYKVRLTIEGYNPKDSAPVTVTDPVVIVPGDLEGTVSISPATAEVGDILTASYDGSEGTGVYTWTGACADGQTGETCTTTTAGTYKVTLTIEGYNPKSSANVTVTDPIIIPEDLEGTVLISPSSPVLGFDVLTASYTGSEDGVEAYIWTGACEEDGTGATCTPTAAGTYSVTLNISGYNPKDSAPVTVAAPSDLSDVVYITPTNPVLGDTLTANYDGNEGIGVYTWIGTCEEGQTGTSCTPTGLGTYTVKLTIPRYNPKDSAAVTVVEPLPETLEGTVS